MNEAYEFISQVLGFDQASAPLQEIIFAIGLSFLLNLLIAFLPAAIIGFLAHDWIKALLFNP